MQLLHPPIAPWLVRSASGCRVQLLCDQGAPDAVFLRAMPHNEEELIPMQPAGCCGALWWLDEVRQADEDSLLTLATQLPAEAAEALIELATGGTPRRPQTAPAGADPFAHPDAQRRFRVMQDVEELERALEFPWDQWMVFLHPAQRQWVERDHGGPARVSGSAGTGKTIVALHRAVHLARSNGDARVLLTTFTPALAHALHMRLRRLVGRTPRLAERIDVVAIDELGDRLFKFAFGKPELADDQLVRRCLADRAATPVSRSPWRAAAQRIVLRRRLGPADLPAAVFVEVIGGGCAWTVAHTARQLPHLAPDSHPGRPAARP
jgi:UvrD/REP helicase N-terminal domain